MLIDDVTIEVKAGNGGNGAITFRRNAQTAKGGPDGGNGGNGGSVYVVGINDISGLTQFKYKKTVTAENGVNGGKQNKYGRNGESLTIRVPLGTTISDRETGESWEITDEHTQILLAQGGTGGRGNNEFKSATNQTPTFAEPGQPGQQRTLHVVMHLIADIGLIGLPNAGKSSLLTALTNARPKIGNYPFTTLEPNLGVMMVESHSEQHAESSQENKHIVLADIPGLIEGASRGKGLGIKFLKHVEKTHALVHCIDSTTEDIQKTYQTVRGELDAFSHELIKKDEIILLTKIDLVTKEELEEKVKDAEKLGKEVYTVSVYDEASLTNLRTLLQKLTTNYS